MNIDSATTATGQAEDEARKRRFVRLACVVVGGASLAYLLASPWLAHRSLASLTAPAIFLLTGLLALLRRQGAHAAGLALVLQPVRRRPAGRRSDRQRQLDFDLFPDRRHRHGRLAGRRRAMPSR